MINFYELLGIPQNATKEEIKIAYHCMLEKYHTTNIHIEENQTFASLKEAKDILSNTKKREEYDSLLREIKYSKQFSVQEEETYHVKMQIYVEKYKEGSIKKWQYFLNYFKNGRDPFVVKLIKCIFLLLNFFLFVFIKGIVFGLLYLLSLTGKFVDYFAGFLMFIAIVTLLFEKDATTPNYIPFIPASVEVFCFLSIITFILETVKYFVLEKSINLYALSLSIEHRNFIFIINE